MLLTLLLLLLCLPALFLLVELGASIGQRRLGRFGTLAERLELDLIRLDVLLEVGKPRLCFFELFLLASGTEGLCTISIGILTAGETRSPYRFARFLPHLRLSLQSFIPLPL